MTTQRGHGLQLNGITHRFGEAAVVRDVSLDIRAGELVGLLGPSGCGKSTLLRIISGFIRQTEGQVLFDGQSVDHLNTRHRGVGIVFQNYALFPHMTVAENVAYGLEAQKWPRADIGPRVNEMLTLVHMRDYAERRPRQLSGGQQQRIALARCLAVDPKLLLLDEPFGALDKNLRLDMQIEVKRLQREYGITTVIVTHDQEEALSMADRIAVMNRGCIEQFASPTDIYDRPQSLFVNQFVGTTNVLPGELLAGRAEGAAARLAGGHVLAGSIGGGTPVGAQVLVSVRPEHLQLRPTAGDGTLPARVRTVLPLGPTVVYEIELRGGPSLKVNETREGASAMRAPGDEVFVAPAFPAACRFFPPPTV